MLFIAKTALLEDFELRAETRTVGDPAVQLERAESPFVDQEGVERQTQHFGSTRVQRGLGYREVGAEKQVVLRP